MISFPVVYAAVLFCASSIGFGYLIGNVEAITLHSQRQLNHVSGLGGTTSVHWNSKNSSLLLGTKKGGIFYHSIVDSTTNLDVKNGEPTAEKKWESSFDTDRWAKIESTEYKTKYPIYSMEVMSSKKITDLSSSSSSSIDDTLILFCGSGDRWISVWKLGKTNPAPEFEFVQKLGPHTGWVKDLVYDDNNQMLHSIGCNCIETWDCSSLVHTSDPIISHKTKRAIENSPTMGTTLSSDLLCLCLLPPRGNDEFLVTGGVDGRIHLWLSDPIATADAASLDGQRPLHTALAHDGRVNAIIYSSATKTIFTVGNDGSLGAYFTSKEGFELASRLKLENNDSNDESLRITVASIIDESEEQGTCSLALGCSNGELFFVEAKVNAKGSIDFLVQDEIVSIAENSMIYSIACEKGVDPKISSRLWIGHASGLATVDI